MRARGHHIQVAVEQDGPAARAARLVPGQHVVAATVRAACRGIQRQVFQFFGTQRNALGRQAQIRQGIFQELGGGHFLPGQAAALDEAGQRVGHVLAKLADGFGDTGLVQAGCCDAAHCFPLVGCEIGEFRRYQYLISRYLYLA
ncbi:hypothetical protein D3C72_1313010 [compost metagenome]